MTFVDAQMYECKWTITELSALFSGQASQYGQMI